MGPDPRHCFACDVRLDEPPPDEAGRIRWCRSCQADLDAHNEAIGDYETLRPEFLGVTAPGVALPGWPTDVTVLALELWGRFARMSVVEVPGPNPPPQHPRALHPSLLGDHPPQKWVLTTDVGTVHFGSPGSGGTPGTDQLLAWDSTVAPSLPAGVGRLDIRAQAPGSTAETSVDLGEHPVTRRPARVVQEDGLVDSDPDCPSCGPPLPEPDATPRPGIELDWAMPEPPPVDRDSCRVPDPRPSCATCRSQMQAVCSAKSPTRPRPDRVIATGAELGPMFGAELVVPAVSVWSTWFDLSIVGNQQRSAWARGRAGRWTAQDDRGRTYRGATVAGGSGLGLDRKDLSFVPALAPDAAALSITFPAAFDGRTHRATIDLRGQ